MVLEDTDDEPTLRTWLRLAGTYTSPRYLSGRRCAAHWLQALASGDDMLLPCLRGAKHRGHPGQTFTEEALATAFELSEGQPWLVNALAREIVDGMKIPAPEPITAAHIDEAQEHLILARATHRDSLLARLTEPRVKRILEPLIAGDAIVGDDLDDDVKYARDLGLIARKSPVRVANPIYREVIVRVLASAVEANISDPPRSLVLSDGRLASSSTGAGRTPGLPAFWTRSPLRPGGAPPAVVTLRVRAPPQ